ncbi:MULTISPECIES: TrkH family potassium uptake protein [Clostridium]|uniref:Trk family potassium uptake protein n=1 Tax=Clostridium cadaveris TaxID=1529 RepID=A0A1I2J8G5_9CLOT|nr:TrkH family potassium uptake protein [Clostridium cadaveris]MDU4951502.1 TrkH family potassium uptake protein [Clostridium sp.]MDM8312584.1 TrkH family potassium uptake protein [Clostridium cadaveris]MDY4949523.1 TrkH family potassium uptake protein [Clostridium cadaveris]NME63229.1 Trk family potassium uptake protein [Clostridium cadaveris]NWK10233.1 Trk family potassium uptake protein [Clostridium cadaveris]
MQVRLNKKFKLNAVQVLVIGFAIVILTGALLLTLPISSADGTPTSFIDSLFTSTSATCITGLITLDTATHWSTFGKVVIITLIQVGGLGFMAFTTLFALILGKKITLKQRLIMQEAMNTFSIQGLVSMMRYILIFTFSVEFIGAMLLSTQFIPMFGVSKGIAFSFFHSISAFCNAGFDLMGNFSSLTGVYDNSVIILTIGSLIIVGGIGFSVWVDIYKNKDLKKLSLHSKLVLSMTAILIVGGAILMFIFEFNNPNTMGPMGAKDKILSSVFAAVTPRTAGFNSISTSDMTLAGRSLTIILMFVGASPGSTGGGIKTSTAGILLMTVICVIRGREDTEIFKKRINKDLVYKAFTIVTLSLGIVIGVTMILSITEVGASLEYLIYEVVSAFGTVGLTLGLTPNLTTIGKVMVALTMYCGRVGPMTLFLALTNRKKNKGIRYPEDKILVG